MDARLFVAGLVSAVLLRADEQPNESVMTALYATTLSGYVDTMAIWQVRNGKQICLVAFTWRRCTGWIHLSVVSLTLDKPLDESQWVRVTTSDVDGAGAAKRRHRTAGLISSTEFSFNEAYVAVRLPVGMASIFTRSVCTYNAMKLTTHTRILIGAVHTASNIDRLHTLECRRATK